MRLTDETAGQIKACKGVYNLSDVARHFNKSKGRVHDIWAGKTYAHVKPTEAPVIEVNNIPAWLLTDVHILFERRYSPTEIARTLRISQRAVMQAIPAGEV